MAYKSKYKPEFPDQYKGDINKIVCRSSWERWVCKFFDGNKSVKWWSSEETIIKYFDVSSNKWRRYFPDFVVQMTSGKKLIIEVKPDYQTCKPRKGNKRKSSYLKEQTTYNTYVCKWAYAKNFASKYKAEFQIWTEYTINRLGGKIN